MFPKMSNDTAAEELVAPTSWMCVATKSDNGLSAKVEIYHGNMKATTGERPHVKIMAASKANDVQVYVASQSSGSSKQSVVKVAEITEQVVQEYLLALIEKLVAEGPAR
jgi:5,10-methylene-tetrahydrofolate dehydrogenase/methenyl tetrahydrofolate cyclohydrolase